jgi:hypothetical protein
MRLQLRVTSVALEAVALPSILLDRSQGDPVRQQLSQHLASLGHMFGE